MPRAEGSEHHLAIASTLSGLSEGADALDAWLKRENAGVKAENRAHLVFDEIVTNIIRYAYGDKAEHSIGLIFRADANAFRLIFEDDGKPFDPRETPDLVMPGSLAEASIGGRGLFLVRKAADALDYERTQDGHNRLTMTLSRV